MSTTTERNSRCLFLELPPELRIPVYQSIAATPKSTEKLSRKIIQVSSESKDRNEWFAKATTITRVSRQIRHESLPIIYEDAEIWIWIARKENWEAVCYWANRVADSAVLQNVRRISFLSLRSCVCSVDVEADGESRSFVMMGRCMIRDHSAEVRDYSRRARFRELAESKLEEQDVDEDGRRLMTKDVMRNIVRAFCKVSSRGRF